MLTNYYSFDLVPPALSFFTIFFSSLSFNSSPNKIIIVHWFHTSVGTFLTNRFVITPRFHSCRTNTQIGCGSQSPYFLSFIQSSKFNDATYFLLSRPPPPHPSNPKTYIFSSSLTFCAFFKIKKIGIANDLVYKIIGMELHFVLFIKIWNWNFFWVFKNYWDGIFCIQGHDETAPLNYLFCVY